MSSLSLVVVEDGGVNRETAAVRCDYYRLVPREVAGRTNAATSRRRTASGATVAHAPVTPRHRAFVLFRPQAQL